MPKKVGKIFGKCYFLCEARIHLNVLPRSFISHTSKFCLLPDGAYMWIVNMSLNYGKICNTNIIIQEYRIIEHPKNSTSLISRQPNVSMANTLPPVYL